MTFPGGAYRPQQYDGFPQQGSGSTQQFAPVAAQRTGRQGVNIELTPTQAFLLAAAGLGLINLFLGFTPFSGARNFFEAATWVPALALIGGLATLPSLFPGRTKADLWPAVFSFGVCLPYLLSLFYLDDLGAGAITLIVTLLAQTGAAVTAYLFESGAVQPALSNAAPATHVGNQGHYEGPHSFPTGQPGGYPHPPASHGGQFFRH